jgi:hypothetical protein
MSMHLLKCGTPPHTKKKTEMATTFGWKYTGITTPTLDIFMWRCLVVIQVNMSVDMNLEIRGDWLEITCAM